MQSIPMTKALVAANYHPDQPQKLTDELVQVRRSTPDGQDFISRSASGRLRPELDCVAAICGYADLIRDGFPVKLAGLIISRLRAAMRLHPEADQLVTVRMENGNHFTLPADMVDVTSGYTSGGYIASAMLFDIRNLRLRARRVIEVEDVA